MIRPAVLAALVAAALPAGALEMTQYGRLLDGSDHPVDAELALKFALWSSPVKLPAGETPAWSGTYKVNVVHGIYSVVLGREIEGNKAIPEQAFDAGPLFLSVTIDSLELSPRLGVGRVPLAASALHADEAAHARAADEAAHAVLADTAKVAKDVDCIGCIGANELGFDPNPADGSVTEAKLATGAVTAGKLAPNAVRTPALEDGSVTDAKIAGVSAGKITGLVKASQIEGIAASQVSGSIPASQISGSLPASQISGSLPASQISGSLPASQLSGTLPATQISGSLPASQISGSLPATQISGPITISQLSATDLTNFVTNTVQSGNVSWKPPVVTAPSCTGKDGEFQYEKTKAKLWFCMNGTAMRVDNAPLYTSCRDIYAANAASPSAVYQLYPEGVEGLGIDVYCDFTTLRNGSRGWGLLAVATNDSGGFWSSMTDARVSTGVASPTTPNYLLGIEAWRRFMPAGSSGRTIVAELQQGSGGYTLTYPQFQLDASYNYRHATGPVWQHNDANGLGAYTGTFTPTASGSCLATPGWFGACGYTQFGNNAGTHGINASGAYQNPPVTGITRKTYWFQ